MIIDILFGHVRGDERHVVEGRHQDAAVHGRQVHVAVKLGIHRSLGITTVARQALAEPVFRAAAQAVDHPGQLIFIDDLLHPIGKADCQRDGVGKDLFAEGVFQAWRAWLPAKAHCLPGFRQCRPRPIHPP